MAKLTRVFNKIFGSNADSTEVGKFGSLAAGSPVTTNDPALIQSLSNWLDGWFAAVTGENSPAIEDMNAVHFLFSRQLSYLFQAGIPEWDTSTTYYIGSMVNSSGFIYVSVADDNTGNAVTDNTKWRLFGSAFSQKSADYTLTVADDVVEFDATGAERTATLPAANAAKGKRFTIVKTDTSANAVIITDGTLVYNLTSQYDAITVYSNGTVYYALNVKVKSEVYAESANGHGAVNSYVRRWTTVTTKGKAITYSDSANNGGKFTANESGLYAISYSDQFNANSYMGIVKNGSQGATSIGAGTITGVITNAIAPSAGQAGHCSTTLWLDKNDYVWCQDEGFASGGGAWQERFRITKLA